MPLHFCKRIAILQWYNSLSKYDLQTIKQLADGKFLCDIIDSTFISVEENPTVVASESFSDSMQSIPENSSQSTEHAALEKPGESTVQLAPESSAKSTVQTVELAPERLEKSAVQIASEKLGESGVPTPPKKSAESGLQQEESGIQEVCAENGSNKKDTEIDDIIEKFEILKNFINDTYKLESEEIITYAECINSDELELAKVAIFILSAVVKYLLDTKNDKLNTLTLLDHKVQEDIQECLTVLFEDVSKVSRKEVERILCKQARYKISPRKSSSAVTPQRKCASKYRSYPSPSPVKPLSEDIFTDSPLKSFWESPIFRHQLICKDKELSKTRKTLLAEEIRNEDLQMDMHKLKKQLNSKDEIIAKLRNEVKEWQQNSASLDADLDELKKNHNEEVTTLKKDLQTMTESKENLEKSLKFFEQSEEARKSEMLHYMSMMESEIKIKAQKKLTKIISDQKEAIENLENEIKNLEKSEKKLEAEIAELRSEISQYKEKEAETQGLRDCIFTVMEQISHFSSCWQKGLDSISATTLILPEVTGECIGNIKEEEKKDLRSELENAEIKIKELQKGVNENNKMVKSKQKSDSSKDDSDISMPELIDESCISGTSERRRSLRNVDSMNPPPMFGPARKVTVNNSCQKETNLYKNGNVPAENSATEVSKHPLWANFNDSGYQKEDTCDIIHPTSNDKNELSNSPELLLKQLGLCKEGLLEKSRFLKEIIIFLKALFAAKGSNGYGTWDQEFKTLDDYIMCLSYIKNSLINLANNISTLKDYLTRETLQKFTDAVEQKCVVKDSNELIRIPCNCETDFDATDAEGLKEENGDLQPKIAALLNDSELTNTVKTLKEENEALKIKVQKLQDVVSSYKTMEIEYEEMIKKCKEMKTLEEKYTLKKTDLSTLKKKYFDLLSEKKEMQSSHERQIKMCRDRIISFESEKKRFIALAENERKMRKKAVARFESLNADLRNSHSCRNHLEKEIKRLSEEKENLTELLEQAKRKIDEKNTRTNNSELVVKKMKVEVEVNTVNTTATSSEAEFILPDAGHINANEIVQDTGSESSMSGALFNRSLHSGFLCNDDEEDFLNHSSIAEIKKDYDASESKSVRLEELHRRNTMCLPHLRSTYPVELQNMSPFNKTVYAELQERFNQKESDSRPQNHIERLKKEEHAVKKRKASAMEHDNRAGPNKLPATPAQRFSRAFKAPTSLQKLLRYRKIHHIAVAKPRPKA